MRSKKLSETMAPLDLLDGWMKQTGDPENEGDLYALRVWADCLARLRKLGLPRGPRKGRRIG